MQAKTYKIETERLIIRCYQAKDAMLLKASIDESLEHLLPWMAWAKHEPESIQKKRERLQKYREQFDLGIDYAFGIFDKTENVLIGSTGLHTRLSGNAREIGYWINVNYLKQGFASEAVKALVRVGFEIEQVERIEIRCAPHNIRSQGIPRKLGFSLERILENKATDAEANSREQMIWTMLKEDYLKSDLTNFKVKAFDIRNELIDI